MDVWLKVEMQNLLHCAECHGPVETRDVLEKEVSTMNSGRGCHEGRGARADCATCNQLGH